MNRRQFTALLGGVLGALAFPLELAAKQGRVLLGTPEPSIAAMLSASFPAVINDIREGRPFVSSELNALVESGQVTIRPLGAVVDVAGEDLPAEFMFVWVVWSKRDEEKNSLPETELAAREQAITRIEETNKFLREAKSDGATRQ